MLAWLKEPLLEGLEPGTPAYFAAQKSLLLNRPLIKRCYDDWYERLLRDTRSAPARGAILELGSGGSYLKDLEPSIITSDVVEHIADRVIDARRLPFGNESVRAILLTHTLHHIPDVDAFFAEAQRVLIPGGVIAMIEITHTPFARFFFTHCHREPYRDDCREWSFAQADSMLDSNQALAWIVFVRDRSRFEQRYPTLKLETLAPLPWFTYFVSGGVTARYLVPNFMNGLLVGLERLLEPFASLFALHWHICVRKKSSKPDCGVEMAADNAKNHGGNTAK